MHFKVLVCILDTLCLLCYYLVQLTHTFIVLYDNFIAAHRECFQESYQENIPTVRPFY